MAFEPHDFVLPWDVVYFWGCVPGVEKEAARQIAAVAGLPFPYAVADLVDVAFIAGSPLWWETRRNAWRANWLVEETEIEIDELTVRVYYCDAGWPADLRDCVLAGGCASGDSNCSSRPAWSDPGA